MTSKRKIPLIYFQQNISASYYSQCITFLKMNNKFLYINQRLKNTNNKINEYELHIIWI